MPFTYSIRAPILCYHTPPMIRYAKTLPNADTHILLGSARKGQEQDIGKSISQTPPPSE